MGSISSFTIKDEPIENLRPLKGIGGTCPGCACDIPSHSYQYSFDPNPDWSSLYAPAAEICAYLQGIAKTKLGIENISTGETFEDDADVLISARGSLNNITWPDIPGLNAFQGEVMHSAKWNQNYDFQNKILKLTVSLAAMESMGFDANQPEFSPEQRKEFANNPQALQSFRRIIEVAGNTIHWASFRDSEVQKYALLVIRATMKDRLAKKPDILEALVPSFAVGCRRLTPGPGYLEALTAPNVDIISEEIDSITSNYVRLESGKEIHLDVLVCATGFHTTNIPRFSIIGKHGQSLEKRFTPYSETYLSITVNNFPNLLMMLGPNSNIGSGSLTRILESEGDYIVKCIRKLQKEDSASMVPKKQRVNDFSEYCKAYFEKTIYLDECRSWYKDPELNRITGLWPGSTLHALEAFRSPRWEDFEYEPRKGSGGECNALNRLGNGWSVTQLGAGDQAW
ncbi:putative monooxygenase [Sclerotinia borealis F-4128]|uniref:Putative monooxygenase n=1 Tax=Sclerotinia borealis (strain F-4128) TaxID=1432307 RepID=W9C2F9_SCLBF|nr:putative monooxygenase [Sclerotinia borealis F-4128]